MTPPPPSPPLALPLIFCDALQARNVARALGGGRAGKGAFDCRARVFAIAGEPAAGGGIYGDKRHFARLVRLWAETNGIRRRDRASAAVFRSVPLRPVRASCEMPGMSRSDLRPVTVHMIAEHVVVAASRVQR